MVGKVLYFITLIFTLALVLFLNGTINTSANPLPPLGKFLDPFHGVWKSDTKNEHGNIVLENEGLSSKVEIIYDERRVAHIFASNLDDALFAQGYVEAQNRLFQMEFLTLAASGELSSVLGERTLEFDLEKRRRGMKYAAENAIIGWEKFQNIKSEYKYVDGVNAYIKSLSPQNYPLEFKLFNISPSEWTPLKSALVFKQMSLTLAGRNDDITSTNLVLQLGKEDFDILYPEKQTVENPVIPLEQPYAFDTLYGMKQNDSAMFKKTILNAYFEPKEKGIGSNSWAVSGKKTSTGKPIFCNDPHLSLGLPSIWFELHIHTPDFNAYGVSFPGMPGIMIGFNDFIAWGETNVGQDVEDLFVIQWADKARTKYILDGKERNVTYRYEAIKVKGGKTIIDTVKYTVWGPIYRTSTDGNYDLAMRWMCHDIPDSDEYNVFVNAMNCKSYNEYLKATEGYISPAQNFGCATVSGDIGLRVNGRFPAKYDQDGRFVEYGNNSKNNWQAWLPKRQNPQILNPQREFIASSNQVSADKSYPYYFTGKFERYRNRSVNTKLAAMSGITAEDMKKMQQDAFSFKASDLIEIVKAKHLDSLFSENDKTYLKSLCNWNFQYNAVLEEPVLFELVFKKLIENTWDELTQYKSTMDIKYPENWRLIELLKTDPKNKYFDLKSTQVVENADDILVKSLKEGFDDFNKRKKAGEAITWGKYKPLHIYHMTRLPALSSMDIEANGCPDAINATGNSFGPSWRMVVSLEDHVKAYGVYPGGQSGNPASKFYKNMITAWVKGEYYPLNSVHKPEDLRNSSTQSITLNPK